MVRNEIEGTVRDSIDAVKDGLRKVGRRVVLPEEVIAFLEEIAFDEMSYSDELDLQLYERKTSAVAAKQLQADLARLPKGLVMMVCPGTERQCGGEIVQRLGVSERVPPELARLMQEAIDGWRHEMAAIGRAATKQYGVPVEVRMELTAKGPMLSLGYGREHGHHAGHDHAKAALASMPEAE